MDIVLHFFNDGQLYFEQKIILTLHSTYIVRNNFFQTMIVIITILIKIYSKYIIYYNIENCNCFSKTHGGHYLLLF